MGKRAFPPLPTCMQLMAVYPALFFFHFIINLTGAKRSVDFGDFSHLVCRCTTGPDMPKYPVVWVPGPPWTPGEVSRQFRCLLGSGSKGDEAL